MITLSKFAVDLCKEYLSEHFLVNIPLVLFPRDCSLDIDELSFDVVLLSEDLCGSLGVLILDKAKSSEFV